MFFINIAAFLAYFDDISIDFVMMLLYVYSFFSFLHVFFFSTRNFLHIDKIW